MKRHKIANVLLEDTNQFFGAPKLYCRATRPLLPAQDGSCRLVGPGSFDFATFFNGLSVMKWRTYTVARSFCLHLELRGAACTVTQTRAGKLDFYPQPVAEVSRELKASKSWQAFDLPLAVTNDDVIVAFTIEATGEVEIRNSYYYTEVEDDQLRDVELALATTTFRKEEYITANIQLVRDRILGSNEELAKHFRMYVIDNGRTLDAQALSHDGITVYPNDNVGGSGGFAYGMLLAQREPGVTHVLLMDDDVHVSPESILRTYNLLRIVNDEYAEAFVSGAMMNDDEPDRRREDVGIMTGGGIYEPAKYMESMNALHAIIENETYIKEYIIPGGERFGATRHMYAAWWYCVIPVDTIRQYGMPLPVFVRFDDAEYGMRVSPKFITMNGICIWHMAFEMRYNAGVERYQTTRNGLIGQATTGVAACTNFMVELDRNVRLELMKFNYTDAELALEGFEDFLRGPGYFSAKGVAEQRFMDANRNKEQLIPYNELREQALAETGVDIGEYSSINITCEYPPATPAFSRVEGMEARQLLQRTINGLLFMTPKPKHGPVAIIDAKGWSWPYGKIVGVDTIIAIDTTIQRGAIRHRDNERGKRIWKRYQNDLKLYKRDRERLEAEYRAARDRITSVAFWEDYLGLV